MGQDGRPPLATAGFLVISAYREGDYCSAPWHMLKSTE